MGCLVRDYTEKEHKYHCTEKEFREIKIEDISFSKEEFEEWKAKEILPDYTNLVVRAPSLDGIEENNDPK